MRTYERVVESETLASGTEAAASVAMATSLGLVDPPVRILSSSGRELLVAYRWEDGAARGVFLAGQARLVAEGTILPEALMP
jgi:diaminopimelate epimerase